MIIASEPELVALAAALGADKVEGLVPAERALLRAATKAAGRLDPRTIAQVRDEIRDGRDPLGDAFCTLRDAAERRPQGATYTPLPIVDAMIAWARDHGGALARVVDPGAGSGRFVVAAGRAFPAASLVAVELDPLAALLARAHLAASGLARRARVLVGDYRNVKLPALPRGRTLFLGNPPYVRHHDITPRWKRWLTDAALARGLRASQLAGLHVHFFLATLDHARDGDLGAFITAAEWLDVNYGQLVRQLFLDGLGGSGLHVVEPTANPFPDAMTTAAITCFTVGRPATDVQVRSVARLEDLGALDQGRNVPAASLASAPRWSPFLIAPKRVPAGHIELGEICRVSRGQVTGANKFWIAGPHAADLPPELLVPTITKARELIAVGLRLADATKLRRIVDLPEDLDTLPADQKKAVQTFLRRAREAGVDRGYIATHRRAWWSVGLYAPAPILATYMARRAPAFVRNLVGARHINIAHGLYPRTPLAPAQLDALARHLSSSVSQADGRTYAGGLTKFEPREMERLHVPLPDALT